VIDNGVMFQDKHGIRYYANEPDSNEKDHENNGIPRTDSFLDTSVMFFEGFNDIAAEDKISYMQSKIQELKRDLQREQMFKQNVFAELEEQEAKENKLIQENV
jgi:hypothetical protein